MATISEESRRRIINVAETLVAEGVDHPTNEQVLQKLGGGSMSYVSPVMREWREKKRAAEKVYAETPDSIKELGQGITVQIWSSALKLAMTSVEAIKKDIEERAVGLESELNEVLEKLDIQATLIKDLDKALEVTKSEANQYRDESVHLRAMLEIQRATDEETTVRCKQLADENKALLLQLGAAKAQVEAFERVEALIKDLKGKDKK